MTLQVAATGAAPLSYQWKRNGANIPGATATTYMLPVTTWDDNGAVFSVTVANGVLPGGISSNAVRLSLRPSTAGLVCSPGATAAWCWASPQPTGLRLNGVTSAGSNLVATSSDGAIVRSTDGGASWTLTATPGGQRYNAVAFATPTVGVAVGESGSIARTIDGGASWTAVSSSVGGLLRSVAFANATVGVIAGGSPTTVLRTTDGGASWVETAVSASFSSFAGIAFGGSGRGVLIADQSAFITADNGATWSPISIFTGPLLSTVSFASSNVVVIASGGSLLRSVDGGTTWVTSTLPLISAVAAIAFQTESIGLIVTRAGGILRTTDAGVSWSIVAPENPSQLSGLQGVTIRSDGTALAVGATGVMLRSADSGVTWTQWPDRLAVYWNGVAFADERHGIAVGRNSSGAAIARTADGGRIWAAVNATSGDLEAAAFATPTVGVAVGFGSIRRTTDAGATWTTVVAPPINSILMGVTFLSPTVGVAVGAFETIILRTSDAGATWTSVTPAQLVGSLFGVAAIDASRVIAVGHNGGVVSNDGGLTWTALPPSSGIGMQLRAVAFGDGGKGMAIATDGTVVHTADSGATWKASTNPAKLPASNGVALKGNTGIVVGWGESEAGTRYGMMQTTVDAGGLLTTAPSFPSYPLRAAAMPSPSVGVVVGESGVIAISNGGN